jgi:transcriptional regulator with XRE-family HTH domain
MTSPVADPANARVGARIRELRKARRFTQEDLAQRAGITWRTVVNSENGHVSPRNKTRQAIADALGVPVEYLEAAS